MLPDQSYGSIILQSIDGQDFYIADMIGNKTFSFIENVIKEFHVNDKTAPQDILALLADRPKGVTLSKDYCCPKCKKKLLGFTDNVKTVSVELEYATWDEFESLKKDQQLIMLHEVLSPGNKNTSTKH